jgi:uncharacterized damage-inducible protein DinB
MTKDDIQLLYEYDRWANERVLRSAAALSPEQFAQNLGGSFGSVRDTLLHIVGGDWIWLAYWKNPPSTPAALSDLRARREVIFNPDAFPDFDSLRLKWIEVQREQEEFIQRLSNESLTELLPFRTTQIRLAHLMQHVANHSTYHRGQITMMMRLLGAEPAATDFHSFLVERGSEVAD